MYIYIYIYIYIHVYIYIYIYIYVGPHARSRGSHLRSEDGIREGSSTFAPDN